MTDDSGPSRLSNWLDDLQYRMAECLFRPRKVLSLIWQHGKMVSSGYLWAMVLIFLGWCGLGVLLGPVLSDPRYFSLDSPPSVIGWMGQLTILVWMFVGIYLVMLFFIMTVAQKIRDLITFFSKGGR
ncbi:MAG: hypothetical protein F4X83_12265 [Chloroflexi bacterium]|nr:hypothetical protein [Chloroflexota bacterium]